MGTPVQEESVGFLLSCFHLPALLLFLQAAQRLLCFWRNALCSCVCVLPKRFSLIRAWRGQSIRAAALAGSCIPYSRLVLEPLTPTPSILMLTSREGKEQTPMIVPLHQRSLPPSFSLHSHGHRQYRTTGSGLSTGSMAIIRGQGKTSRRHRAHTHRGKRPEGEVVVKGWPIAWLSQGRPRKLGGGSEKDKGRNGRGSSV
jgi:hypothetical protein